MTNQHAVTHSAIHCALTSSLSYPVITENVVDRLLGVDSGPETIEKTVVDA